jgi:hypothetical protein
MLKFFRRKAPVVNDLTTARLSRCIDELRLVQKQLEVTREQLALALDALQYCAKDRGVYSLDARILQARIHLKAIVDLE